MYDSIYIYIICFCIFFREIHMTVAVLLTIQLPYGGKLWREKTLANLANCLLIAKVLSPEFLGVK